MNYQAVYAVTLGPQRKLIRYPNLELAQSVHKLVPGSEVTEPMESGPVNFSVEHESNPESLLLKRDTETVFSAGKLSDFAVLLNNELISTLVDDYADGLALHSACLVKNGRSLLMPAASGSGKTTLTAWLLTQEFSYASDELVISFPDSTVRGFARPLNIKPQGFTVMETMGVCCNDKTLQSDLAYLTKPELLGANEHHKPTTPRAIVFPAYRKDAVFEFEQLSPTRASHLLLACLINARNLPKSGLSHATALCKSIPAWSLTYSDFDQLDSVMEKINQAMT